MLNADQLRARADYMDNPHMTTKPCASCEEANAAVAYSWRAKVRNLETRNTELRAVLRLGVELREREAASMSGKIVNWPKWEAEARAILAKGEA